MQYLFLALCMFFLSYLPAQVGINNPNPGQALDVGGKIKVGDDQIAPVAGTIRYNRVARTFEGYDGTEWSVFNPEEDDGDSSPPAGTIIGGEETIFNTNSTLFRLRPLLSSESYNEVPAGRTLYVTTIILTGADDYVFDLQGEGALSTSIGNRLRISHQASDPSIIELHDPNGYLLIIPAGESLRLINQFSVVTVQLRGFLQ